MFLLAYHVSIDEHRSVQYVIEQYGENNKQSIGMYIQLHQTSALSLKSYTANNKTLEGIKFGKLCCICQTTIAQISCKIAILPTFFRFATHTIHQLLNLKHSVVSYTTLLLYKRIIQHYLSLL